MSVINPEPLVTALAHLMVEPVVTDCSRCGHRLDEHDRVALRYCEASGDHGVERGCICHGKITTAADAASTFHA